MSGTITILALWCALVVCFVAYRLIPAQRVSGGKAAALAQQMLQMPEKQMPWYFNMTQVFQPLLRYLPTRWIEKSRQDLYWAQLAGQYADWDAPSYWCLRIGLGAAGLIAGILVTGSAFIAIALAVMAFMAPSVRIGAAAKRVRRQFLRELPEVVELLRLETAAGGSVIQSLNSVANNLHAGAVLDGGSPQEKAVSGTLTGASSNTGYVSRWLRRVTRLATGSNLFASLDGSEGILLQEARASGLQQLIALAVQLDIIARRGTDPGPLLASVATSVSDDFLAEMDRQAEKIGAELIFPTFLFFFVPFMIAVLLPLLPQFVSFLF